MENCLFDRIGKRNEVINFLKDQTKRTLHIKYEDSADCPEHFIEWLKGFLSNYNEKGQTFQPVVLKAETLFINPDPYKLLDEALASFEEFSKFHECYHQLRYDKALNLQNAMKKDLVDSASWKKTLDNFLNTSVRTILGQNTLSVEKKNEIRTQFFNDLGKRPDILFIIHINAKWKNRIHEIFKELIPQNQSFINKFIFVLRHRSENDYDLTLGTIEKHHIEQYLQTNAKKLQLDDLKIENFCSQFSEPSKYATVRSKAVQQLRFNEITGCNQTKSF